MACTANRTSSLWHNFVSDTDHWKETDLEYATLCQQDKEISDKPEVAPLVTKGAKKVWIDAKTAHLEGSPAPKQSSGT